jgi:hypothetical protein
MVGMIKKTSMLVGMVLLMGGVMGFVPGMSTTDADGEQLLFGVFMTGPFHNAFHVVSGMAGLAAARADRYAGWYLQIFGLTYAVLASIGFAVGIPRVNTADNILHAAIALVMLGVGFGVVQAVFRTRRETVLDHASSE